MGLPHGSGCLSTNHLETPVRVRSTTTGSFTTAYRYRKDRTCGGSWPGGSSTIATYQHGTQSVKTIRDVKTPGFHALLKCGKFLPLNPVEITTVTTTRVLGSSEVYNRPTTCSSGPTRHDFTNEMFFKAWSLSDGYPSEAVITSVVNGAAADARSSVMDVLTFLAEFRELQGTFVNSLNRVKHFGMKAATFARRARKDPGKAFSGKWLEYRYGWLPALYSLQDAVKALTEGKSGWVKGRASQTVQHSDTVVDTIKIDSNRADWTRTETVEASHKVRGWAAAQVPDPFRGSWGFDPVLTTWELVPFSFVADWFIQVGTWIEAVSPFSPGGLIGSCASVQSTITRETFGVVNYLGITASGSISTGGGTSGTLTVTTERYVRFPSSPSLPGWNPRITPTRLIDAIALALSMRGSIIRALTR